MITLKKKEQYDVTCIVGLPASGTFDHTLFPCSR